MYRYSMMVSQDGGDCILFRYTHTYIVHERVCVSADFTRGVSLALRSE
jgi:hypothetical protein